MIPTTEEGTPMPGQLIAKCRGSVSRLERQDGRMILRVSDIAADAKGEAFRVNREATVAEKIEAAAWMAEREQGTTSYWFARLWGEPL